MINRRLESAVATYGLACAVFGCSGRGYHADRAQVPPLLTAAEAQAVGCYRLLAPVRNISGEFSLLASYGHSRPEQRARLIRPRGPHNSAYWREWAGDTLQLVWATAVSDSTRRNRRAIIYGEVFEARVVLVDDTLRGHVVWRAEALTRFAPQSLTYGFRAKHVACADGASR